MPFAAWTNPALTLSPWRLCVLAISILLLRRIPAILMLQKWIPDIKTFREACFAAHFGPMGTYSHFPSLPQRCLDPPSDRMICMYQPQASARFSSPRSRRVNYLHRTILRRQHSIFFPSRFNRSLISLSCRRSSFMVSPFPSFPFRVVCIRGCNRFRERLRHQERMGMDLE